MHKVKGIASAIIFVSDELYSGKVSMDSSQRSLYVRMLVHYTCHSEIVVFSIKIKTELTTTHKRGALHSLYLACNISSNVIKKFLINRIIEQST